MKTSISKTAGKRTSTQTVWFADGTRGAATKQFFSLFVHDAEGVYQVGNYRTKIEAETASKNPPARNAK